MSCEQLHAEARASAEALRRLAVRILGEMGDEEERLLLGECPHCRTSLAAVLPKEPA